jgi:hypothetical protein
MCDEDAAPGIAVQKAREVGGDMRKPRIDEDAASQIRAHIVAHQSSTPARHVYSRDIAMPFDAEHGEGV